MTDLTFSDTAELSAQLLEEILNKAHPLLAEGLYLAAIAHSYDLSFFAALRARDDERDERLMKRLARFSFIHSVPNRKGEYLSHHYQMQMFERDILLRRWIKHDREAFIAAQQRSVQFWAAKRLGDDLFVDSFTLRQNQLYHLLIVAPNEGVLLLSDSFREYLNHRFMAAIERLILTGKEVLPYLELLEAPQYEELADLLLFLDARLAQLRGQWADSLQTMLNLQQKPTLAPRLLPYVVRGYALALMHTEQYVEAIKEFKSALKLFGDSSDLQLEVGYTMIGLGDAYVRLATSARGYRERITLPKTRLQEWVRGFISLPILPVMLYLSWQRLYLWHPASWHALQKQDWIIARLFAAGANWYRRADELLENVADSSEWGRADSKLAWLYLVMGESRQTVLLFRELLAARLTPLSEYNRASIQVGLANGLVQLGKLKEAESLLLEALPRLVLYEDWELQAAGLRHLAEVYVKKGQLLQAIKSFGDAMRLYQQHQEIVYATEVAERLWELQDRKFGEQLSQEIAVITQALPLRQYLVRYQKKSLVLFGRMTVILLAFLTFLIPMLLINLETETLLKPQLDFTVTSPIPVDFRHLYPPNLTLSPQFPIGVEPKLWLESATIGVGLAIGLLYFVLYTLFGIMIIARTKMATVQKAAQRLAIQLDEEAITVGNQADGTARTIRWADVTHLVIADLKWLDTAMWNHAVTIIASPSQQLIIRGSTAWYSSLQKHIDRLLPDTKGVQKANWSYSLLRSRMALLYTLGLLSLFSLLLFIHFVPNTSPLINSPLLYTPYSLVELYPYFYLSLVLPPFWWFAVRPISILARIGRLEPFIWWVISIGVAAGLLDMLIDFAGWLRYPNIYPSLVSLILLTSGLAALWERSFLPALPSSRQDQAPIITRLTQRLRGWGRVLLSFFLLFMILMSATYIVRQVEGYHYLSLGNMYLKQAFNMAEVQEKDEHKEDLEQAIAAFQQVLLLNSENVLALRGRAAALIQSKRFEEAIKDYDLAHSKEPDNAIIYAERAAAYQTWSMSLPSSEVERKHQGVELAIADFTKAITLQPNLNYYLGRGIAYQGEGNWEAALKDYDQMLALQPNHPDALMAKVWAYLQQGNALYRLSEYPQALESWQRAVKLLPNNAVALFFRATGYWRLATLKGEVCRIQNNDLVEQTEQPIRISQLEDAYKDLSEAIRLKPDGIYYRTRAQLAYLLRHCPGYSEQRQLRLAIADYQLAILYDMDNPIYWQYLARLQTALHLVIRDNPTDAQEAYELLASAAKIIERAYLLDPNNSETLIWRNNYILNAALEQGEYYYAQGNYPLAEAYFKIVFSNHPN